MPRHVLGIASQARRAVAPQHAGEIRLTLTWYTHHVQCRVHRPVVLGFPPSAVHILFRARPAVQSAYDANSTFVIRPDALAGFATTLLVPRYVAGVRGVEEEKRSFPSAFTREDGSITPFAHASTGREDASITSPASLASRP